MTDPSPSSMADLESLAEALLEDACARFPLPYKPAIRWKKLRVSAGMAYYRTGVIGLSSYILDTPEKLRITLLHEYAHLLAVARHGPKAANHGSYWQKAMLELGLEPKVRHNFEVVRNSPKQQVTYRCQRCGADILRTRRLPRNRNYVHARCGGGLKLAAVVKK